MGFDIDPERDSRFEKECSCFEGNFLCLRGLEGNARNYSVNGSTSESNNGEGFLGWYYGIFERG